jgi:hypothetical protein
MGALGDRRAASPGIAPDRRGSVCRVHTTDAVPRTSTPMPNGLAIPQRGRAHQSDDRERDADNPDGKDAEDRA